MNFHAVGGGRRQLWAAWAVVAAFGLLAYANSFSAALSLDNKLIILHDPRLRSATWESLSAIFSQDYWRPSFPSNLYRPLTTLSFWFNYTFLRNGAGPAGYHWVNLAIHLANAGWVIRLAARLARSTAAGLVAGLIFATHPVAVEAVTNVVGRADLLAAFFVLSALYCHWEGRRVGCIFFSIAGLLCKENAIVIVPAAVGLDLLCFRDQVRERAKGYWSLLPVIALFGAIQATFGSSSPVRPAYFIDNPIVGASRGAGLLTACAVQARYLGLLFWPAHLSCDYSYNQIPLLGGGDSGTELLSGVFLAALAGLGWTAWRYRANALLSGGLWCYAAFQLPTSNFLKVIGSIMAERFLYLPLVGFAWAAAAGAALLTRRLGRPGILAGLGLIAAAALSLRTRHRNNDWQTDLSLWSSAVQVSPHSYKTHKGLAAVLAEVDPSEAGLDRAIAEAEKAQAILDRPDINDVMERRETTVAVDLGQYYQAKADFRRAAHDPAAARAYLERTIAILQRAVPVDRWVNEDSRRLQLSHGTHPDAVRTYGREDLYQGLAVALLQTGRTAEAVPNALAAIRLNPFDPAAFEFLASCENRLHRTDAAILGLYLAIFANPHFSRAWDELGELYAHRSPPAGRIWLGTGDARTLDAANSAARPDLLNACRYYDRLLRSEAYQREADDFRAFAARAFHFAAEDFAGDLTANFR